MPPPATHLPPRDPGYRIYIDESGDHAYSKLDDPWHRYLCLVGVWFKRGDDYDQFADGLTKLKRDVFRISADDRLHFHRADIKGRKGPFGLLNDPAIDKKFCAELVSLTDAAKFTLASVIIDKKTHSERYRVPMHPYHFSMTALIDRYGFWLAETKSTGDAMIEARGRSEDQQLDAVYRNVASVGTRFLKGTTAHRVLTSKSLKIRSKADDIAGLQLADLLAHPIKVQALHERDLCEPRGGFARELAAAARPKYRGYYKGTVSGRGRVWL